MLQSGWWVTRAVEYDIWENLHSTLPAHIPAAPLETVSGSSQNLLQFGYFYLPSFSFFPFLLNHSSEHRNFNRRLHNVYCTHQLSNFFLPIFFQCSYLTLVGFFKLFDFKRIVSFIFHRGLQCLLQLFVLLHHLLHPTGLSDLQQSWGRLSSSLLTFLFPFQLQKLNRRS